MRRSIAIGSVLGGVSAAVVAAVVTRTALLTDAGTVGGYPADLVVVKVLHAAAVVGVLYGTYLIAAATVARGTDRRRAHNARNLLRLVVGVVGFVAVLAVLAEQWVGLLVSLGVVGFAVTFALQQPLLSLIAWTYIALKQPYGAGDRVAIGDAKGDVIEVDFLVTTLWEINGELVSSDQPSGRVVSVPNSVVLSSEVVNFGGGGSPYVWNEIGIQVAYETDLAFARRVMREEADDLLGEEMAAGIAAYREALAETPVELAVNERPSVNVTQRESWVELRLRYLTLPREGQRTKNELYERVLERFADDPDRVAFPVSRSR